MKKCIQTILFAVLTVFIVAPDQGVRSQRAEPAAVYPRITGSTILADLQSLKNRAPNITARELAGLGNEMIVQKGTTYVFDVCDFLKHNGKQLRRVDNEFFQPYSVRLTTVAGEKRDFQIAVSDPFAGAGCYTKIAAVRVTSTTMTAIADGKPVTLLRPQEFRLAKTELVDETLKRVIRRWETPFQLQPLGISPDGMKIYLDVGVDYNERRGSLNELAMELSENGGVQFRAHEDLNLTEGKRWRDRYVRFRHNGRSFILKPQFDRNFMVMMVTGMLVPPEPIHPIETRPFPQRNPTSYEFPGSVPEVREKILATLKDFDVMQTLYSMFTDKHFHFSVEDRENALFAEQDAKQIFADPQNKDDLYLHSYGEAIGASSLYLGGGMPLPYAAEFHLHFTAVGPNKTRVSLLTLNPRVYNGTVCCGMHGYKSNTVTVEPTTIEEYKILLFMGRRLGVSDMPPLRLPEGTK